MSCPAPPLPLQPTSLSASEANSSWKFSLGVEAIVLLEREGGGVLFFLSGSARVGPASSRLASCENQKRMYMINSTSFFP